MVKLILVRPKSVISYRVVSFNKELKVRIVYFALYHPLLDHLKNWTRNLFYYSTYELLSLRTAGKHESVYCRANCAAS